MTKLDYEDLAAKALCALIEANGGSIESALDDMYIKSESERELIKQWFGWDWDDDEEDDE